MIEVKDATIAVGGKTLAEGLSFMAKDGQLTCITGEEGVGKTTLLRTLIGFLPVAQGFVSVDGELLTVDSAQAFRSLMIYLPQEMRLLAHQLMLCGISCYPVPASKNSLSLLPLRRSSAW